MAWRMQMRLDTPVIWCGATDNVDAPLFSQSVYSSSVLLEIKMSFCRFPAFTANKKMKNRALIVSVENFYPDAHLTNRPGVKKDTQRLHKILMKLGFSVDIRVDMEAGEIYKAFKEGKCWRITLNGINYIHNYVLQVGFMFFLCVAGLL